MWLIAGGPVGWLSFANSVYAGGCCVAITVADVTAEYDGNDGETKIKSCGFSS